MRSLTPRIGRQNDRQPEAVPEFGRVSPEPARRSLWWLLATALAIAAVSVGAAHGFWYLPLIAGTLLGLVTNQRRLGAALTAGAVMVAGPVSWGLVLLWMSLRGASVGATARIVAAVSGLPPLAVVTVALTLLVALLQAAAGLWLGRAVARIIRRTQP
jgi:hypothetical protein